MAFFIIATIAGVVSLSMFAKSFWINSTAFTCAFIVFLVAVFSAFLSSLIGPMIVSHGFFAKDPELEKINLSSICDGKIVAIKTYGDSYHLPVKKEENELMWIRVVCPDKLIFSGSERFLENTVTRVDRKINLFFFCPFVNTVYVSRKNRIVLMEGDEKNILSLQ